jgi:protoporphyrinogen oxidase
MKIEVIGGGAGGMGSALAAKENYPEAKVVIFEKSK